MNDASSLEAVATMYTSDVFVMYAIDAWNGSSSQVQIFYNNSSWTHPILMNGGSEGVTDDYMCGYHIAFVVDGDGIIRFRGSPTSSALVTAVQQAVEDLASSPAPDVLVAGHKLLPGYPNPFNPMTRIPFELADGEGSLAVKLEILDMRGRVVRTLVDGYRGSGARYEVSWDGTDETGRRMPSGSYMSRLKVDGMAPQARLLTLVK